jgi:tRNA(Ile)-lysidine synthase
VSLGASDAEATLGRVREEGLLDPDAPLVVMLSGGRDSVCLLDLASRLSAPPRLVALHVNYGLREGSRADEEYCAALCERLRVELRVERPRRPDGPGNLQAWARESRYRAAHSIADELGEKALIATGHTADDQVETILYRLASSPGRRALLGMRPRDGRIVRPLLSTTREETTAYCRERGLAWRDDPSNEEAGYARNRVRHGLAAALAEVHPAAARNVLRTAAVLRDEAELLDTLVDAELEGGEGVPAGSVSAQRLRELHPALRRLVVQRLADRAADGLVPGAARYAEQVAALRPGGMLDLGGGIRAVVEGGVVRAERG